MNPDQYPTANVVDQRALHALYEALTTALHDYIAAAKRCPVSTVRVYGGRVYADAPAVASDCHCLIARYNYLEANARYTAGWHQVLN